MAKKKKKKKIFGIFLLVCEALQNLIHKSFCHLIKQLLLYIISVLNNVNSHTSSKKKFLFHVS